MTVDVVHAGRWTQGDRAASRWPRLPFAVPDGCPGVTVELACDSGAVIDLGCEGPAGWRGWSGAARRTFTITADAATPGYAAGPLETGEWHVVLGLHRVPADGAGYEVRVSTARAARPGASATVPTPERPPRRELPAERGLRWLACDLHAHTVHSDGTSTVDELAARAVTRGLDLLAVTDHNTVSHHAFLPDVARRHGVALLPGQELTTDLGHANAFGSIPWVDFREPPASWARAVTAAGGVFSVNHPLAGDCGWLSPVPGDARAAEVWHSSWLLRTWNGPVAWWRAAGAAITPLGGSDFHASDAGVELGTPVTWVCAPDESEAAVLDAIRAGRTAVSAGIDAPALLRVGDELLVVGDVAGAEILAADGSRRPARVRQPAPDGGAVLVAPDGTVVALSG